jgi:hypothetical protein
MYIVFWKTCSKNILHYIVQYMYASISGYQACVVCNAGVFYLRTNA